MISRICPECKKSAHSADTRPRPWVCPSCGGNIPWREERKNMTVHEMKADFVTNELAALIRKIDKEIERAEYTALPNGEEFVHIFDPSGRMAIKICVTADSLSALTRDVLRAIE